MTQASNESIETSTNIGAASDEFQTGGSNNAALSDSNNSTSKHKLSQTNGHYDPKQRRIYLALFGLTVASALTGFLLILVWMFNFRKTTGIGLTDAEQLANLHPVMMFLFMVSVNMYAVLVYRTHYNHRKDSLKKTHAILGGINMIMSLLGVIAMIKSHLMTGRANFYSLHSWIGLLTNVFYAIQFISGFVAFMKPGLAQHRRASIMPWHRFVGTAILVLAGTSAITGIVELVLFQDMKNYSQFAPITFIANFAGVSVVLMTALAVYLLTAQNYLRPRLHEEEPLKR